MNIILKITKIMKTLKYIIVITIIILGLIMLFNGNDFITNA